MHSLGIREMHIAPRSPWQSPYLERPLGSIRRECLDHVIVFNALRQARIGFLVRTGGAESLDSAGPPRSAQYLQPTIPSEIHHKE